MCSGAADRRRQPRLGGLADHLLVFVERPADDGALLLGLVGIVGEQVVLRPVVRHQFPAAFLHRVDDAAALLQDHAVAGAGRRDAHGVEHVHQPPDPDALAVFAPCPVRGVEHVARKRVRNGRRAAGKQRLLLAGAKRLPVLDVDRDDQRHMRATGKFQRRAVRQRHEFIGRRRLGRSWRFPFRKACARRGRDART